MSDNIVTRAILDAQGVVKGARLSRKEFSKMRKDIERLDNRGKKLRNTFNNLLGGVGISAALYGLQRAFAATARASLDWETALVGVGKTTGLAGKQLSNLGDTLVDLSVQLGTSSNNLAGIAKTAGQLGVSGAEDLSEFTKVVFQLSDASDLTAESGAIMLARFLKLSNMDTSDIEGLSDIIVNLGNNMAVGEQELTAMLISLRQGSLGIKIAAQDLAALAAVMSESNIQAEAARTSFQKILQAIKELSGADLLAIAEVVNKPIEEVQRLIRENPNGLYNDILFGVNGLNERDLNKVREALDANESRRKVFFEAGVESARTGRLTEAQIFANSAEGATAREAQAKRETNQAIFDSANAQLGNAAANLGDLFTGDAALLYAQFASSVDETTVALKNFANGLNDAGETSWWTNVRNAILGNEATRQQYLAQGDSIPQANARVAGDILKDQAASTEIVAVNLRKRYDEAFAEALDGTGLSSEELNKLVNSPAAAPEQWRALATKLSNMLIGVERVEQQLKDTQKLSQEAYDRANGKGTTSDEFVGPPDVRLAQKQGALDAYKNRQVSRDEQFILDKLALRQKNATKEALEELNIRKKIADLDDKIATARKVGNDEKLGIYLAQRKTLEYNLTLVEAILSMQSQSAYQSGLDRAKLEVEQFVQAQKEEMEQAVANMNRFSGRYAAEDSHTNQQIQDQAVANMDNFSGRYMAEHDAGYKQRVEAGRKAKEETDRINREMRESFVTNVANPLRALFRGDDLGDALGQAFTNLRNQMIEMTIIEPIMNQMRAAFDNAAGGADNLAKQVGSVAKQAGSLGGGGGFLSGLLNFGASFFGGLPAFAEGGISRGGPALVGERGPEIVDLPKGAAVYPNGSMPASMGQSINVTNNIIVEGVQDPDTVRAEIEAQIPTITNATRVALTADAQNSNTQFGRAVRG